MKALHYILLGVIAAFLYIRYERKRRRRIMEHDLYRDQLFKSLRQREMAIIDRTISGTPKSSRPMPPPPPPDRKRYTYKATEPPPPSKRDDNDYLYTSRGYPFDSNPGYIPEDTSHHSATDHGGGGDFGGGGSTDSWGGSSDSGSSSDSSSYDSGSSSSND